MMILDRVKGDKWLGHFETRNSRVPMPVLEAPHFYRCEGFGYYLDGVNETRHNALTLYRYMDESQDDKALMEIARTCMGEPNGKIRIPCVGLELFGKNNRRLIEITLGECVVEGFEISTLDIERGRELYQKIVIRPVEPLGVKVDYVWEDTPEFRGRQVEYIDGQRRKRFLGSSTLEISTPVTLPLGVRAMGESVEARSGANEGEKPSLNKYRGQDFEVRNIALGYQVGATLRVRGVNEDKGTYRYEVTPMGAEKAVLVDEQVTASALESWVKQGFLVKRTETKAVEKVPDDLKLGDLISFEPDGKVVKIILIHEEAGSAFTKDKGLETIYVLSDGRLFRTYARVPRFQYKTVYVHGNDPGTQGDVTHRIYKNI